MAITRYSNPFAELQSFQDQIGRLLDSSVGRNEDASLARGNWIPPVDVAEEGDSIILKAELPGMKEEDIEIEFENGLLTLKGERSFESEKSERNYHRIERSYGKFVRSFNLPRSVDAEAIAANYENGVLEVTIPKREEAKPRQIRIGKKG